MYYARIPLRHVLSAEELVGGVESFNTRMQGLKADLQQGRLPTWATSYRDLRDSIVIEEGPDIPEDKSRD